MANYCRAVTKSPRGTPVVHIDNQEQLLVAFSYIFADFRQMGTLVLQKIRETLKSVRAIFDVSSRY